MLQSRQVRVIARKKMLGIVNHVALLLPNQAVVQCSPGKGVNVTTLEDFSPDGKWWVVRVVPLDRYGDVIVRINLAIAERREYNSFTWNCEIFANWATGERAESPQAAWGLVAGALGIALLFGVASD